MNYPLFELQPSAHELASLPSPIFITGTAYCGKSEVANACLRKGIKTAVIGTAPTAEPEFAVSVQSLRKGRPDGTFEISTPENLVESLQLASKNYAQILVDSTSQWLASRLIALQNTMTSLQIYAELEQESRSFVESLQKMTQCRIIIVGADTGGGSAPAESGARMYRRVNCHLNRQLARVSRAVVEVRMGTPILLRSDI
jgi:adenosyl cobinamide kinase/adenosyl cobinamide phosphate guanylyltransferase